MLVRAFFALILILLLGLGPLPLSAQSATPEDVANERYRQLEEKIKELEEKLTETRDKRQTLAAEVAYMNSAIERTVLSISLTEKKIKDLTAEIATLSAKIDRLEDSLTQLSDILLSRIVATYKQGNAYHPLELFFGSQTFGDLLLRFKYIRAAQASDKLVMFKMQETKEIFAEQKAIQEEKRKQQEALQAQLERQKEQLSSQKAAKAKLLEMTKNDETHYQEMLAAVRAEFEAIQAIIAGKGEETEVRKVAEGERIASVIPGSSCNSSGSHLHFIVSEDGSTNNPFVYLKSGVEYENCSGSSCTSSDGDPFSPSGDWNWPIATPIKFSQGYGPTWAIRNTWVGRVYQFHNGIDINSSSAEIKAVKSGVLFRGSYTGFNGCQLRYVRVDHDDSSLETLYLHVNY